MNQASDDREPDYRAIYRDGALTLVQHAFWMPHDFHWVGMVLRQLVDAVIADFEIFRGPDGLELIVSLLTASDEAFRSAVVEFAAGLGYRRIWMAGELIELGMTVPAVGVEAATTCPACGARYSERQPQYILTAREFGVWPTVCSLAGHSIPQMRLSPLPECLASEL